MTDYIPPNTKCALCESRATLPSTKGPVCEDHWFELLGELVELHPICSKPTSLRIGQGNLIQPNT